MIIEMRINADLKVRADIPENDVLGVENHVANVVGFRAARKVGDVATMDVIAVAYDMEREDARAAARALFNRAVKTSDKRERLALKRYAMKGLRSV